MHGELKDAIESNVKYEIPHEGAVDDVASGTKGYVRPHSFTE